MKYIIFNPPSGIPVPVIFGESISHCDVLLSIEPPRSQRDIIASAGFVEIGEDGYVSCSGGSESLGVSSRDVDHGIIAAALRARRVA